MGHATTGFGIGIVTPIGISKRAAGARIWRALMTVVACAAITTLASCVGPALASKRSLASPMLVIVLDPPQPGASLSPIIAEDAVIAAPASDLSATVLVPGSPAVPFRFSGQDAHDALRATLCLTSAIYYEAGNESEAGRRAVAQVVLNRVRHPAYPDTVCGVVYQGTDRGDTLCQFTFGCDGALARRADPALWAEARAIAVEALSGSVYAPVGLATHYHTLAVKPGWSRSLTPAAIVGAHIFYRWPGGAGRAEAFRSVYRGNEPVAAPQAQSQAAILRRTSPPALTDRVLLPYAEAGVGNPGAPGAVTHPVTPPEALPESDILPAYQHSGQWIGR